MLSLFLEETRTSELKINLVWKCTTNDRPPGIYNKFNPETLRKHMQKSLLGNILTCARVTGLTIARIAGLTTAR